jgi:hypothetical protein
LRVLSTGRKVVDQVYGLGSVIGRRATKIEALNKRALQRIEVAIVDALSALISFYVSQEVVPAVEDVLLPIMVVRPNKLELPEDDTTFDTPTPIFLNSEPKWDSPILLEAMNYTCG